MAFRVVKFFKNSPAFDLQEFVCHSINSAVELYSLSSKSHENSEDENTEELAELISFVSETMLSAPDCIRSADLGQLVDNVCCGVIQQSLNIHEEGHQRSDNDQLVQSVYRLFAAVLQAPLNESLKSKIQEQCLEGLSHYCEEQRLLIRLNMVDPVIEDKTTQQDTLSVKDSLGILDNWLSRLPKDEDVSDLMGKPWVEDCFQALLDLLEFAEATVCSHVSGILLPKLLRLSGSKLEDRLSTIWRRLLSIFNSCLNPKSLKTSNVYISLCGLSEFYIPLGFTTPPTSGKSAANPFQSLMLLTNDAFWQVIQSGLVHTDPLARKQACFLMKRCIEIISAKKVDMQSTTSSPHLIASTKQDDSIPTKPERTTESSSCQANASLFWWSSTAHKKLLTMWRDFFLLYETLDETQVHIVTPVMPRLKSLIQAASATSTEGTCLLHTSWLTVLFSRSVVHETKTVLQWGVLQYLKLDLKLCPLMQQMGTDYFLATFLPVLNDDNLYADLPRHCASSEPPIAAALKQFMTNCVQILKAERTKVFLRDFLRAISDQSWSPISLTFVFDMLMNLPECNAWGPTELKLLREMQFSCVNMLSLSYRSIVQCLMVQAVLRLLDKDGTSLQQLSSLLALFRKCLQRGRPLWKQVCAWLEANKHTNVLASNSDLVSVIQSEVVTLMTFDPADLYRSASVELADNAEASRVACLVLLATDVERENTQSGPSNASFLCIVLAPMLSVLERIGSHIYLPIIKADTALQLLHGLLHHLNLPCPNKRHMEHHVDNVKEEMTSLLATSVEEIFSFIAKRLFSPELAEVSDIERASFYISVLESIWEFFAKSCRSHVIRQLVINGHTRLMQCWRMLVTQSMDAHQYALFHRFIATRLLLWFIKMSNADDPVELPWDALLPLVTVNSDDTGDGETNIEAGASINLRKLSNHLLVTRWKCISKILQSSNDTQLFTGSQSHSVLLSACVRDLGLVKACDAVPIIQAATRLVNMVDDGTATSSVIVAVLDTVWCSVLDEWRGKATSFWHLYTTAVQLFCQQSLLVAECGTPVHATVAKVIQSILTFGEAKPRIVTIFVHHLCRQWASRLDDEETLALTLSAFSNHQSSMVDLWIGGAKVRRGTRIEQEMSVYLLGLPYLQAVQDDIALCAEQRVGQRRVSLLNFLFLVATKNSPEGCRFITTFTHAVLQKLKELSTATRPGYTMLNTQHHRLTLRSGQLLLVLAPYIHQDSTREMLEGVLSSIVREKQPSVRYLMSLFAVQLVILKPSLEEMVWDHVQKALRDDTECSICPLLILLTHLGMVQPDGQRKEVFYRRVFPVLLPWALVQTSSTRHTALLCAKKAWQDCTREGLGSVMEAFPVLKTCMEFVHSGNSPAQSSQPRVDSYFFLFKLHSVHDYTIQTIFHVLPALTSLAEDEFLEAELFEKDCPLLWGNSSESRPAIGLYNSADSMLQDEFRMRQAIQQTPSRADIGVGPVKSAGSGDHESNVQKKIIPWQDTVKPGFEDVMGLAGPEVTMTSSSRSGGSLVLIASLIDKAPNLGGLCRTSQIFGVSTFVISNLKIMADKTFQSLSVTAEKWLPIVEVTVSELPPYLQALRHRGYTLVGVEQTARSCCLTEYQFPERTVLLLGHERTGIPVELIQLLDVCVEIPQQGIVRSLNVHVSGALLVWEYTRQRLLTQKTLQ